jgi:hypothetical protein
VVAFVVRCLIRSGWAGELLNCARLSLTKSMTHQHSPAPPNRGRRNVTDARIGLLCLKRRYACALVSGKQA